jgi:hypothetical protein
MKPKVGRGSGSGLPPMSRARGSDSQAEVLMVQPGPGGVLLFAEEVRSRWYEAERTEGVRFVLGGEQRECLYWISAGGISLR